MTDTRTTYLGLTLPHPFIASAGPLTGSIESLHALADAGVAAVVLPSLFEEQIEQEAAFLADDALGGAFHAEASAGYLAGPLVDRTVIERHLDLVRTACDELPVPVIASLNGSTLGGWTHYAATLADAGAAALELNIHHVAHPAETGAAVEQRYVDLVRDVRARVDIPLAVKIGPFFSSPGDMARRLDAAGADALVLFNRFYEPDIDLERMEVVSDLVLSSRRELRLVLRWIAIISGHVDAHLAATTGVDEADDVVKLLLAGADVVSATSALLRRGAAHVGTLVEATTAWFDERGYDSIAQARGSLSQASVARPEVYERANYVQTLVGYAPVPRS